MSRRDSQEPVALLRASEDQQEHETKPEPMDVEAEAGHAEQPKDKNLDHEYSIPSTVKFAWLGTYFFFSLLLTLYNKLVLGMVSSHILLSPLSLITLGVIRPHFTFPPLPRCESRVNGVLVSFAGFRPAQRQHPFLSEHCAPA